ncbi:hypothetical protein Pint_18672 [Pistacia integerrima]|uniref:Uncharacterized protein n=1 Tax=Pistacia integerrima TaxID=434235 RepID=A0ACC0YYJ9_9ROSI|nr:hypothetical protein Pint_18672 [Pistacia integerrima]
MEASKFLSSTSNLSYHRGVSSLLPCRKNNSKKPYIISMGASKGWKGRDYEGRLVDENMIVPRMCIQEKKLLEANYEPSSNWTQPGFVLGMTVIVALSVAVSIGVLLLQDVEIVKIVLSGFHMM